MKLLVIQPGKIGDLVVTTSLFNSIYSSHGQFDLVASNFAQDFLKCDQRLSRIYKRHVSARELRAQQYTHVLILMPSYNFFIKCRLAGIKNILGTVHSNMTKREKLASFLLSRKLFYDHANSAEEHYLKMAQALGINQISKQRGLKSCLEDKDLVDRFIEENSLVDKKLIRIKFLYGESQIVHQFPPSAFSQGLDNLVLRQVPIGHRLVQNLFAGAG